MQEAQARHRFISLRWVGCGVLASALAACGGGGGSDASTQGTLRLAMTDAPACGYDHVYVTVDRIRVHQSSGASDADAGWIEMTVSPARRIDLLNLTNGALEELGSMPLEAGSYQQIRLVLADNPANPTPSRPLANALVLEGQNTELALKTPSGQQSGLKLQAHFDVTGGQLADLVLDFDACKSIVKAGNSGNYNLKPVVSVFKRLTTAIEGYVDPLMASPGTLVSAQQNGVTVRATVPVQTTGADKGKFTIAWLPVDTTTGSATYNVVVTGTSRSTAVVTGVPVALSIGKTVLNTASTPIVPPISTMANVGGVVVNGGGTLLTDATVGATQALTGGPVIEVGAQRVDALDASYLLSLPLAGPVKAPYVAGGPLVFGAADSAAAGKYSLRAGALGYTTQTTAPAVTLGAAGSTIAKDLVLAP